MMDQYFMTDAERAYADRLYKYICYGRPLCIKPKAWFKRLVCKHDLSHWVTNLYGDSIPYNGNRSVWQCVKCGAVKTQPSLRSDLERLELGVNPFSSK